MTELEKLRKKIERAINKQMKEKKIDKHAHYKDLVKDYLSLWDIKNKLIQDIEFRGVSIKWSNGDSQGGYKKNESISELLKVNKQMLTILHDLGIRASDLKVVEEDEEL
ncbi:hypothetical protein SAMN05660297_02757 [Natronincola peptidivorans]|uniref:Phage terminase, small subunit, putative, P27 family n=1 Tax=Natronincola peptidivorans TaxID=426128 RepID=A0A1I0FCK4_9FIRM|nr:RNA polymerase subunit sigma-70 [Natronincola peptidivorans]SET55794.1 hypothetical protein SAMN05660297_02757 [Natronincola peptidivorans]